MFSWWQTLALNGYKVLSHLILTTTDKENEAVGGHKASERQCQDSSSGGLNSKAQALYQTAMWTSLKPCDRDMLLS